ncbi:MAG: ATP-binding protein [Propionibacteriaceae bacterium]|jgi:predicted AAA+ superfamily ATPase|nr:ATP-binding protein [Propionibacteriaceae bacterium]
MEKPFIQRNVSTLAAGAIKRFPVVAIQGARRVGKSTLVAELVRERPHLSVTLDDPEVMAAAIEDPKGFLANRGDRIMVIDEIQRYPELILAIKADIDRNLRPGSYVLTGSSDFTSRKNVPDSLAGRAVTIPLNCLSQGERDGVVEDFASWVLESEGHFEDGAPSSWTKDDYLKAIVNGGYPEVDGLEEPWRSLWLDSYIDRLTSRDVQDIDERIPSARLQTILKLLAANQSGELVKARLSDATGINQRQVTACLDALEQLYITDTIEPWTANLTKRAVGRSKTLVLDSGLAAHLTGSTVATLGQLSSPALGPLFEGFVMAELRKQQGWSSSQWELTHFRDRNGKEVDGVIQFSDGRVILLEIKSSQSYRIQHFTVLKELSEELGDRLVAGIVLGMSEHSYRYAEKLWGVPASLLWSRTHKQK